MMYLFRHAMGTEPGDEITIKTQWAEVKIFRSWEHPGKFVVDGDVSQKQPFATFDDALLFAMHGLIPYTRDALR